MGNENRWPDLVKERGNCVRDHLRIEGARVGRHLPEVLVQGPRVARELHSREIVGPDTDAENVEPGLLIGRRRYRHWLGAAPRIATPRLVDDVNREAAAQEDVLEALPPVRRGFPRLRELSGTVPEHERKFAGLHRDLIEHIGVIAMKRLPVGHLLFHGVVSTGAGDHGSTGRKTALLADDQQPGAIASAGYCTCRSDNARREQQQCVEYLPMLRT